MSVRHFLDIDGAATLPTEQLSLVDQAVADLVATRAMGAVHGQAGLGKTFAVEAALARRTRQVSPCWVSFPSRPTMRLVAATLLGELSAEPAAGRRDRFALSAELLEQLADHRGRDGREHLVVVDEAQQLNRECIEFLRWLHDHRLTRFGLLLVGGDGTWQVLSREPMLRSRIYRRVVCTPLSPEQVCALRRPGRRRAASGLVPRLGDHRPVRPVPGPAMTRRPARPGRPARRLVINWALIEQRRIAAGMTHAQLAARAGPGAVTGPPRLWTDNDPRGTLTEGDAADPATVVALQQRGIIRRRPAAATSSSPTTPGSPSCRSDPRH